MVAGLFFLKGTLPFFKHLASPNVGTLLNIWLRLMSAYFSNIWLRRMSANFSNIWLRRMSANFSNIWLRRMSARCASHFTHPAHNITGTQRVLFRAECPSLRVKGLCFLTFFSLHIHLLGSTIRIVDDVHALLQCLGWCSVNGVKLICTLIGSRGGINAC